MTTTELLAIAFGLVIGYWLVSRLLDRKPPDASSDAPTGPWHEVLGISPEATVAEIDAAYERLMRDHPGDAARTAALTRAYREAFAARRDAA